MMVEPVLRRSAQPPDLVVADTHLGSEHTTGMLRLHLDEDDEPPRLGDDIDLSCEVSMIPLKDTPPPLPEVLLNVVFTFPAYPEMYGNMSFILCKVWSLA